jgi:glutathione S-transferase
MGAYRGAFAGPDTFMTRFELISNLLCPYTQRAAIQLIEKGLPYERAYIDLAARPAWFAQLSPLGKVPVLRVGDEALFESAVICEYIEEVAPARPMWPTDPLDRARERAWAEFASTVIADVFGFYMAPDAAAFDRKCADLAARFQRLELQLGAGSWVPARTSAATASAWWTPPLRRSSGSSTRSTTSPTSESSRASAPCPPTGVRWPSGRRSARPCPRTTAGPSGSTCWHAAHTSHDA